MTWQQINPAKTWNENRATWMSQLPNDLALQDLSIPGTHDTASLEGFCFTKYSETQQWRVDEQLNNGIRFLDLRVKIMYSQRGLAMYHGSDIIYDPYAPNTSDQLYYKTVIGKCVEFLKQNPQETIIVSVKCEGDNEYGGWTIEDWFRQIANEVAADNPPGTWDRWWDYRSNINATLGNLRGKMVLWRRFPRGGKDTTLNYNDPFALNLTALNDKYDDTQGDNWYEPDGGYVWVQDYYEDKDTTDFNTRVYDKFNVWCSTLNAAYNSRWNAKDNNANRQFINFSSIGARVPTVYPSGYAKPVNAALHDYLSAVLSGCDNTGKNLGAAARRSGIGVVPMDYPAQDNIDLLIGANFGWTHNPFETQAGSAYFMKISEALGDGKYN